MDWERVEEFVKTLADKIDWNKDGEYKNATGAVGGPVIKRDMELILARFSG
jgi:hypothetical protein